MNGYRTVNGETENEFITMRSRFICKIARIGNEAQAKEYVSVAVKAHPFATHNCYGYITEESGEKRIKFSDDGEPQGTAGMPIYEVLKKNGLHNVVAVVTRYFGGIKLGAGGLVRAYSASVTECLKKAEIVNLVPACSCEIREKYENAAACERLIRRYSKSPQVEYGDGVIYKFDVELARLGEFETALKDTFGGKSELIKTSETLVAAYSGEKN